MAVRCASPAGAEVVDLVSAADTCLYESPSGQTANGSGAHVFCGNTASGQTRRGLVRFDVAGVVPVGVTVTSVTLQMFMSRTEASPQPTALHAVLADWGEGASDASGNEGSGAQAGPGDATWIHRYFPDETWSAAGGDFISTSSAAVTVAGVGFYTWTSTTELVSDVQAWLDDPSLNFGWALVGTEIGGMTAKRFDTRENSNIDRHPRLTIEYQTQLANIFFSDTDGDGYGNPDLWVEVAAPNPPDGFVADNTDCDDANPAVNPGQSEICDNGIDDNCDGATDNCANDCDGNGTQDAMDIIMGAAQDCNGNGVPDACDIALGTSPDADSNGIPDACEVSCCTSGDPRVLTMRYTAGDCGATTHQQDSGDVECADLATLPETVFVIASDDEDPFDGGADVWFSGMVSLGELFEINAANAAQNDLATRTSIHILDPESGTPLQRVEFRTNCSSPLWIGDQFGASLIVSFIGENSAAPCPADINGDRIVDVDDLLAVILAFGSNTSSADVIADGLVDVNDLIAVILTWGPCA